MPPQAKDPKVLVSSMVPERGNRLWAVTHGAGHGHGVPQHRQSIHSSKIPQGWLCPIWAVTHGAGQGQGVPQHCQSIHSSRFPQGWLCQAVPFSQELDLSPGPALGVPCTPPALGSCCHPPPQPGWVPAKREVTEGKGCHI